MPPRTAVLFSAGLDSAVLLAVEADRGAVQPIYVSVGLAWERAELAMADALLSSGRFRGRVGELAVLRLPMDDVYPAGHWAMRGTPPAYDTPDEDVYLPGRNLVLLSKAGIYCAHHALERIVIGPLAGNPFPDATPEFFRAMASALTLGLDHAATIDAPFAALHKEDVIREGAALDVPLVLTLSCMAPTEGQERPGHCGACSKCRERRQAFAAAGIDDPTDYAEERVG